MRFLLSFDIGHSSIGWSVLSAESKLGSKPEVHGCGTVIFPADDCLASKRRAHRRTRRNIRATRQRIERIKQLLLHLGVLDSASLDAVGHPAPHVLAARVLVERKPLLTWSELWSVIRWYAHNRGYDGNSRWARNNDDSGSDDTEKEKAAIELMEKHGMENRSMAETICAVLGINPLSDKVSSAKPFKTLNAAFPRRIVRQEILNILRLHVGVLPYLDNKFIDTLIAPKGKKEHRAWETIRVPDLRLPRRYFGGLLFGQLIPRFDNRIIPRCPISGEKVPKKATREYLNFRWAMILANLRVEGLPISAQERRNLHKVMQSKGRLTATELRKELEKISGTKNTNVEGYFEVHPDSTDALVLDPALALYKGEGKGSEKLKPYWEWLPEITRKRACGRWKKGRVVNLSWMLKQCDGDSKVSEALQKVIDAAYADDQKKKRPTFITKDYFLNQSFSPPALSGRAPYSRKVMNAAVEFVLSTNRHPTEASNDDLPAGPLYRSKKILSAERNEKITMLTNNHLIRQRLDILLRLLDDILFEYAENDPSRVTDLVVEVATDLQTYSGLSNEEINKKLGKRLSHFKSAVEKLEKDAPHLKVSGSLIRKCRIAMDMDWKCPYTLKGYEAHQLNDMVLDHIIPFAERPTNALDALVVTYPWVNELKDKRTAMTFINEFAENQSIVCPKKYKDFVKKLKIANKSTHPEDHQRQKSRQKWLMVENYEAKEHGFTAGALTQTSHLNRLSARQLEKRFWDKEKDELKVRVHSIPGQVTAETRKAWKMNGTLALACPEVLDEKGKPKNKTAIRKITHLHHALDATVLGLTHLYLPGILPGQTEIEKGKIWEAMLKRNKSQDQQELLLRTGMFRTCPKKPNNSESNEMDVCLWDVPKQLKEQISQRLNEKRVVQHIPSDQSGSALEETTWRYICEYEGRAVIVQKVARDSLKVDESKNTFGWESLELKKGCAELLKVESVFKALTKYQRKLIRRGLMKIATESLHKVIGLKSGKLNRNQAVRIIANNYGLALSPRIQIIPFHNVNQQIKSLVNANGGQKPLIIRNGMLLQVNGISGRDGLWRVVCCQASLKLDLTPVERVSDRSVNWREVNIQRMIRKNEFAVVSQKYTGGIR